MSIAITCANCGKIAIIEEKSIEIDQGKIDPISFVAPKGFRKVMIGTSSEDVHLYCTDCGISADLPTFH
ncbi:hypothetical protein [Paraburkholderia sp. BL6665CI2N2]|uniref:hypothetical protein n=1 Tax=Paraburkholderia sp. BL6665CI2N2 TaxID=1938806 RepID=UPI0010666E64|nr:hypothetical protein [Paraburkholderia sp. BL6665CI2N2]